MQPTREPVAIIGAVAGVLALAIGAVGVGLGKTAVGVAIVFAGVLFIAAAVAGRRTWRRVRRWYRSQVAADEARTRAALGHPTRVRSHGAVDTWRYPDLTERHWVHDFATYKRLAQQGKVDPTTTKWGPGPTLPPLPEGWIGRWRARRAARRHARG